MGAGISNKLGGKTFAQCDTVTFLNTGSAIVAGAPVKIGQRLGFATTAIAANKEGEVLIRGRLTLPKQSGDVLTANQPLAYDTTNDRVSTDLSTGVLVKTTKAAGNGTLTVECDLNPEPIIAHINRVATGGEAAANNGTWAIGFTPVSWDVQVLTTAGVNEAGMARTISGSTVTFAATDITASSVIRGWAIGY